jgi:Flp pilus assembly protein TadB
VTPFAAVLAALSVLLLVSALAGEDRHRVLRRADSAGVAPTAHPRRRGPSTRALVVGGGALGVVLGIAAAGAPGGIGVGLGCAILPLWLERRSSARRARRAEEQLLDAVTAIAAAVRSGRSLVQALAHAGAEVSDPLGGFLVAAGDRVALGASLDRSLEELASAIGGADARLFAGVLRLHRRTGGALGSALDDLAITLRARRSGSRELRSLTAQARLSAAILGLLPVGFFLFLSVVSRRDIEAAYRTPAGASAIAIGLALQGAAFVWIRRLLRVDER